MRGLSKVGVPKRKKVSLKDSLKRNWQLYVLVLPAVIYFLVFNYMPLYGIQIAFKDYKAVSGIIGSQWVGLKHFEAFFNAYYFKRLLSNTFLLNIYNLLLFVGLRENGLYRQVSTFLTLYQR